jgi:hypothetical protein
MMDDFRNIVLCVSALLLMGGCESVGPKSIKSVHHEYNNAIVETNGEQLLLNIVRLKYRDSPYFIEVSNVSENRKFTTRVGPSGSKIGLSSNSGKHELGIIAYSEVFQNPTISYTPIRGEDFTKRMLAPLPVAVVLGLIQAGWSAKRVFNLGVECINRLDNAGTASGPTPMQKPEYESFVRAVDLMDDLYAQRRMIIGVNSGTQKDLILKFTDSDSQVQKLKSLLGVDPDNSEFRFSSNFLDACDTKLIVRTRSVMEILFYLSHAVRVPQKDVDAGLVTETKDKTGKIFDWSQSLSGKWIAIDYSEDRERPQNAFISVFYRGKWFYIADNNLNTKSTFMLINHLFNLQAGNSMASVPMLTISAN